MPKEIKGVGEAGFFSASIHIGLTTACVLIIEDMEDLNLAFHFKVQSH